MTDEIKPEKIYTPKEARDFLKISESTMKRMMAGNDQKIMWRNPEEKCVKKFSILFLTEMLAKNGNAAILYDTPIIVSGSRL